jgi:hypothetical protein
MNRKTLISISLILLVAIIAFIYFGLIQGKNFSGSVIIPCNDTAEYTYSGKTRLLIKVKESCGTLNIETKDKGGKWSKLTETDKTLGTPKPVDFEAGYAGFVEVKSGGAIRFVCYNGEKDSCKLEVINLVKKQKGNTPLYTSPANFACDDEVSTHVYNFIKDRPPVILSIRWTSVCKKRVGGRVSNQSPEIWERGTKERLPRKVKTVVGAKPPYQERNYLLKGNQELFIKCPGNSNDCKFTVSAVRK